MFSPRIQQLSAAKYQTIYAPIPPKESSNTKSLDFVRAHRIVSSVTVDHIRDIRSLDHTTMPPDNSKRTEAKRLSEPRSRNNTTVTFIVAGDGGPVPSREPTAASTRIVGSNDSNNKEAAPRPRLVKAEVRFAQPPRTKGRMMSGGFALMRDRVMVNNNTNSSTGVNFSSARSTPNLPPLSQQVQSATTPGRSTPYTKTISPGPFYSAVRGTIRLSAHNRKLYTPNRSRRMMPSPGTTADEYPFATHNESPEVPSPDNGATSPINEMSADLGLTVTGLTNETAVTTSFSQAAITNVDNTESSLMKQQNQLHRHLPTAGEDGEEDAENNVVVENGVSTEQAPPRIPIKLPTRHQLQNNAHIIVHDAFMPRENAGGWMFRQKWLRLFARNGASGLAYAYSSKLQNSFS